MNAISPFLLYIGLTASLIGLWAASYIHQKKRTKTKLICPLQANCEKVIHSTHATTLGISNDTLGIVYYIVLGLLYAFMIAWPVLAAIPLVVLSTVLLTGGGILFSLYLIFIQLFVLRAWCSWCLLSAFANSILTVCAVILFLSR